MTKEVIHQEPTEIWRNFAALNAVPRASKKEERVRSFIRDFGKKLQLETEEDAIGNILIRKPATKGLEQRKTVVLQSHLDMVHQKNSDTVFDFDNQGIQMTVEGDWIKAKGTTLGADNGLGVATIMALLESTTIEHPKLEALFTVDEETGMTGAFELRENWLQGEILLNLDTEDDDEIGIGCAGGIDVTGFGDYQLLPVLENTSNKAFVIEVKGLQGGHSGMDIHKGLGNANVLMTRLLTALQREVSFGLHSLKGGSLRNAIPRESAAVVVLPQSDVNEFHQIVESIKTVCKTELQRIEPDLVIEIVSKDQIPGTTMQPRDQERLLHILNALHHGVFAMSLDLKDLVATSNNLAKIVVDKGIITIDCLVRSSLESGKQDLYSKLASVFALGQLNVKANGDYPGWTPNLDSEIVKTAKKVYEKLNNKQANVMACHAGLECGIIAERYPNLDMVSFGPTIKGAHSPDERVSISSVQKFWKFTQELLCTIS